MSSIIKPPYWRRLLKGHPLSEGLVGCWLMNEGNGDRAYDLSTNGFNLDAYESHAWLSGKYGYEINFVDSNPEYTYLSTSQNIGGTPLSPTNITIVAHVKLGHTDDSIVCSAWRDGDANNQSYMLWHDKPIWEFIVRDSGGTAAAANGNTGVSGTYIHLAGTYDGSNAKLYENGVLVDTDGTASGDLRSAGAYPLQVGTKEGAEGSSSDHFRGQMSYVYIYNRALSASNIQQLYLEPFSMFSRKQRAISMFDPGGAPPAGDIVVLRRRRECA